MASTPHQPGRRHAARVRGRPHPPRRAVGRAGRGATAGFERGEGLHVLRSEHADGPGGHAAPDRLGGVTGPSVFEAFAMRRACHVDPQEARLALSKRSQSREFARLRGPWTSDPIRA